MVLNVGTDIEQIASFVERIEQASFMKGVYTQQEQDYIVGKAHPAQTAAGLYCAKEAAAKALGRGFYGLKPKDLEIFHDEAGAPQLRLLGSALEQYRELRFSLSISHSGDFAIAVCAAFEA